MKRFLSWALVAGSVIVLAGCAQAPVPIVREEVPVEVLYNIAMQRSVNALVSNGYVVTKSDNKNGIISTRVAKNEKESKKMEMPIREKVVLVVKKTEGGTATVGVSVVLEAQINNKWVGSQEGDTLCEREIEKSTALAMKIKRAMK